MNKLLYSLLWTMRLKFPVYRCVDCSELVSPNGPDSAKCNKGCNLHCLGIKENKDA